MLVFPGFGNGIFVDTVIIIIILRAEQRSHSAFSGKVGHIKEVPDAKAISLFSAPPFFFNRSEIYFENKCIASYPAFKDCDDDGENE